MKNDQKSKAAFFLAVCFFPLALPLKVRQNLKRAQPCGMFINVRNSHDFIYFSKIQKRLYVPFNSSRPTNKRVPEPLVHSMLLLLVTHAVNVIYWKLQWSLSPLNHSQCPQLNGCEQTICFLVCVGRNYIDSSYDIGFLQSFRGPEPFPIDHNCCIQVCWSKVACKSIG
jgi:hypothetical protein